MRGALAVLLVALVAAPAGWLATDALEQDNDFCVACHLDPDTPLHRDKAADFVAAPPASLVAAHHAADAEFRCIDCHGGASFLNRARVKAVAARDSIKWAIGRFEEPRKMHHPLWDEDCRQCHESYSSTRDDDFHAISDHNLFDFDYRCVECHSSHVRQGASPELSFLSEAVVLPICRNCHEEF